MKFNSKSRTKKILAATWIIPVVLASPYTFTKPNPFVISSDLGSIARQTCTDRFDEIDALMYGPEVTGRFRRWFFTFLFLAIYLIPMIVILTTCVRIAICLLQPIAVRRWPPASRKDTGRRQEENKRRVARMVMVVAVAFIVSWSPFYLTTLVSQIQSISNDGHNFMREKNYIFTMLMIHLCGFLNSTINPLIYTGMSNKFRRSFKMILSGCICCRLTNRLLLRYRDSLTRGMSAVSTSSLRQSMTEVRDANDLAPSDAGSSPGGGGGGGTADGPNYGVRGSNLNHGSLRIHGGAGGGNNKNGSRLNHHSPASSQQNKNQTCRHFNQSPSSLKAHDSSSPAVVRDASPEVTKKAKSRSFRLFKSRDQGEVLIELAPLRKSSSKKKKQQQQQKKTKLRSGEDLDSGSAAPPSPQLSPQPPSPALKKAAAGFQHQQKHPEASVCDDEKQRFIGETEEEQEEGEIDQENVEKRLDTETRENDTLGGCEGVNFEGENDAVEEEEFNTPTQDSVRTKLLPVSSTILHGQTGMATPVLLHNYSSAVNNMTLACSGGSGGCGLADADGAEQIEDDLAALNRGFPTHRVPAAAVKTCSEGDGAHNQEFASIGGARHVGPKVTLMTVSEQNGPPTANNNQDGGNFYRNAVFGDDVFPVDQKRVDSRPLTAGRGPDLAFTLAPSVAEGAATTIATTPTTTTAVNSDGSHGFSDYEPQTVAGTATSMAPTDVTVVATAITAFNEPNDSGSGSAHSCQNAGTVSENEGLLPGDRIRYDNHNPVNMKTGKYQEKRPPAAKGGDGVGRERGGGFGGGGGEVQNGVLSTMPNGGSRQSLKDYNTTASPYVTSATTTAAKDFRALDKAVDVLLKDSGRGLVKPALRLTAGSQAAVKARDKNQASDVTSPGTIVHTGLAGQPGGGQCVQL